MSTTGSTDALDQLLTDALSPGRIPTAAGTWSAVERSLMVRRQHTGRRALLRVALVVGVLFLAGAATAVAGSADVRDYLSGRATMRGGQIKDGKVASLYPMPSFHVFQPGRLPEGYRLVALGQRPEPIALGPIALPRPDDVMALGRIEGEDVPPEVVQHALARAEHHLDTTAGSVLALVYVAGTLQTLELVEQSAGNRRLPGGSPVQIRGIPATVSQRDGRTVIAWIEQGTLVQLHATAGQSDAMRIAEGTQVSALAPFDTTVLDREPRGANPESVALSERVESVDRPSVSREQITERCGIWDPNLYAEDRSPTEASRQAFCVAQAALGRPASEIGGWATSRPTWGELAARLRLDLRIGPPSTTRVWSVQMELPQSRSAYVVVLDAATGEPYLTIRLRPGS